MIVPRLSLTSALMLLPVALFSALCLRVFYRLYWHPLAKYPGPWYAATTSLSVALISVFKVEPQWLHGLVKKYGSKWYLHVHLNEFAQDVA